MIDSAARSSSRIDRIDVDGADFLHPDFGSNPDYGIPYVVVPGDQPGAPIRRWNDGSLNELKAIPGDAFEVIDPGPEKTPC